MGQDAGDRLAGERRTARLGSVRVGELVRRVGGVPDAPVQVGAAARLVGPRLRRERRDHAVLGRHGSDGLAVRDLVVGRAQGRCMPDRQLLLTPAELGMRQLDGQALVGQGRDDVLDDRLGRLHADGAEAQASVDRHEPVVRAIGQEELVLEGGVEGEVLRRCRGHHPLQERPRIERPGLMVELDHVHDHLPAAWRVGEDHERLGIRHEPDLADRSVGRVGCEEVQARERLHALHEPDPALHPAGERTDVGALAADHAAVVAVQEANELEAPLVRLADDLLWCHG